MLLPCGSSYSCLQLVNIYSFGSHFPKKPLLICNDQVKEVYMSPEENVSLFSKAFISTQNFILIVVVNEGLKVTRISSFSSLSSCRVQVQDMLNQHAKEKNCEKEILNTMQQGNFMSTGTESECLLFSQGKKKNLQGAVELCRQE